MEGEKEYRQIEDNTRTKQLQSKNKARSKENTRVYTRKKEHEEHEEHNEEHEEHK